MAALKQSGLSSERTGSLEAALVGLTPWLKDLVGSSPSALPSVVDAGHCGASWSKEAARALLSHLCSTRCQERGSMGKRALGIARLIKESSLPFTPHWSEPGHMPVIGRHLPPGLGTLSPEPIEGLVGRKIRLHRASGGSWVVPEAMVGEGGGALESDGLGSSLILLLAG